MADLGPHSHDFSLLATLKVMSFIVKTFMYFEINNSVRSSVLRDVSQKKDRALCSRIYIISFRIVEP